jgi:hypothetical protein
MGVSLLGFLVVIPGLAKREPGIHIRAALAACRIRGNQKKDACGFLFGLREWPKGQARRWLWIPGLRLRRIPE